MSSRFRNFFHSIFCLSLLATTFPARGNDQIFPALPAAASAISWQGGSFLVNGKPVFLASGEMHYARITKELWRERLWRMKMMGLNTVQTYVFWNAQEGREGEFNFSDNLDLDAWLSLVEEMGMYAIVRPGPYNCAEWDNGGIPAWLTAKPGMQVRTDYAPYLEAIDRYLGQVYPIIARHQINHGGSVLMVQLENEYPNNLWGTDGNAFLQHIYNFARQSGLEVPLFYSGLHHGNDPAGETPFGTRQNPWFSTEFWTGWIAQYGEMAPDVFARSVRGTWKIVAFGGAGYSYYVVHGGSNFGYTHGNEEGAAYDYSAAIGQAGQLRQVFFPMRRASAFASTFSELLGNSANDGVEKRTGVASGVRVLTRAGSGGTAIFLDNDQGGPVQTRVTLQSPARTFPTDAPLKLAPKEIRAVALLNVPWTTNAQFSSVVTGVLGRKEMGGRDYWVCYGQPGEGGEVTVLRGGVEQRVSLQYPSDDTINQVQIDSGDGSTAVFLVMNTSLADRTWILPNAIYAGPRFVLEDGTMQFSSVGGKAQIYTAAGRQEQQIAPAPLANAPTFGAWTWRDAAPESATAFDDSSWLTSATPLSMERYDSFQNGYGWYRASFTSSAAGSIRMQFAGSAGDFRVYLNGISASLDNLNVKSGTNTLAILSMTTARPKMFDFVGATGTGTFRGVWGPITVTGPPQITWNTWRFRGGLAGLSETPLIAQVTNWPAFLSSPWQSNTAPANRPVFWRSEFDYAPSPGASETLKLQATGLVRGQVWLNGHNLGPVPDAHPIYLPECWLTSRNTLVIFDSQGAQPTQMKLEREADFVPAAPTALTASVQNGKVTLNWTPPVGDAPHHYEIKRATTAGGSYTVLATSNSPVTTFTDSPSSESEVYYYRVSAVFSSGEISDSDVVGARPTSGVRSPWLSGDIGGVGVIGDAFYSHDIFSLSGSGSDIWDTADAFHYVFQPASGDCTITARVISQENTDQWTKAGVMIRGSLMPTSEQVSMLTTSQHGIVFSRRTNAANATNQSEGNNLQTPYWIRVTRSGNTFTGFHSPDGKTWTTMGTETFSMASNAYIGLAVTSHNNAVTCTTTFSNVSLIFARPSAPTGLAATTLSASSIRLTWQPSGQDFVKYALQISTRGTNLWTTLSNTLAATSSEYTATSLNPASDYDFRLQAYGSAGSSVYATALASTAANNATKALASAPQEDFPSDEINSADTSPEIHPTAVPSDQAFVNVTQSKAMLLAKPRKLTFAITSPRLDQIFSRENPIVLTGKIKAPVTSARIRINYAEQSLILRAKTGWNETVAPLPPGIYKLKIRIRDDLGRFSTKTRRFRVE